MTDDLKERLSTWEGDSSTIDEALARITELEARLTEAEAGEDALDRMFSNPALSALAAYEARRKG